MQKKRIHKLKPAGLMDRTDARVMAHAGAEVHVVQPFGTPKNGIFGLMYVQVAETGEFIGLVCKASLVATRRTAPVRDLAAEARDARSARILTNCEQI